VTAAFVRARGVGRREEGGKDDLREHVASDLWFGSG
jgi:hypothetical protein